MRVLQIIADGSPGGGTTHTLQILTRSNRQVSFGLITQKDSYLLQQASQLGIVSFGIEFFRSRLDPRVPVRIRAIVGELGPDIVHAHGGRAAFFCSLGRMHTPIVYTVHGYHFARGNRFFRLVGTAAERKATRHAAHVIFVSSYDLQVAKKYNLLQNGARKSLIRCGISLSRIPRAAPSDSRHVGFIGRLENQKDPLLVLEVFARLPDYALTLVGGGQLEPQVRERINLRGLKVQMLGSLSHDRTLDVLSTLGVLVMTSRWEGLPIIALEAMGAGVPVVATRVGGLSEIIEDGRSGLLVRSRSPEDIAAAVRRLTGDEDLRASIIKNARDRVEALFSEARMLAKLQKVYDEVARR